MRITEEGIGKLAYHLKSHPFSGYRFPVLDVGCFGRYTRLLGWTRNRLCKHPDLAFRRLPSYPQSQNVDGITLGSSYLGCGIHWYDTHPITHPPVGARISTRRICRVQGKKQLLLNQGRLTRHRICILLSSLIFFFSYSFLLVIALIFLKEKQRNRSPASPARSLEARVYR
jgi:hypothetical protein